MKYPTARPGDVLLTNSSLPLALVSYFLQLNLDSRAQVSTLFTHASIVLDGSVALEAVPAPKKDWPATKKATSGWTGSELTYGVRFVPVADLLVDARHTGHRIAVLRASHQPAHREVLTFDSPLVAALLGSSYALDALKQSAEASISERLPSLGPALKRLSALLPHSAPADLAVQLDDKATCAALSDVVQATLPFTEFQNKSYFCSTLVAEMLKHSGLLDRGVDTAAITPSGVMPLLTSRGWSDVTQSDYGPDRVDALIQSEWERKECAIRYLTAVGAARAKAGTIGTDVLLGQIENRTQTFRAHLDEIVARLARR